MTQYGLIGRSLGHSFSSTFFNEKFSNEKIDAIYSNYELEAIDKVHEVFQLKELNGLNVTIPYKESIISFLDEIDELAKEIGSVNTIKLIRSKNNLLLKGSNTDVYGFHQMIKPHLKSHHEKALVLGTGGASKAVSYVLKNYGIDITYVTREETRGKVYNWNDLNDNFIKQHLLIINTTPVGMFPNVKEVLPISYDCITNRHLMIDLIYNPSRTLFIEEGMKKGAVTLNGMNMLKHQALKSWEIWTQ